MSTPAVADRPVAAVRPASTPPARSRLDSVDLLRGLVMVVMALDHTRDFFHELAPQGDPELLADPGLALFLTRWVTHFCAPVFVFLAGTGAYLSLARGKSRADLSRFLLTRGLWLIVLELTVVKFVWTFSVSPSFFFVQVIWVLGVSMIVLAGLVHLPLAATATLGAVMIAGHNLFDGAALAAGVMPGLGEQPVPVLSRGGLWSLLHRPGMLAVGGSALFVRYPLVPWIGVMAVGYAFGALLERPPEARRRVLLRLGWTLVAAFVAIRLINAYGDPRPWQVASDPVDTVIAFLNTQKYPPSLLFLLMTLGPAILLLVPFERAHGPVARFLITFGRVPLFFYVLHVPVIRLMSIAATYLEFGRVDVGPLAGPPPEGWGVGLGGVWLAWVAAVLLLYPVCRWFAGVKARRRDPWLSYL